MMFMFCTAWPEAPLTRLSITDSTTSVSLRPPSGGRCTAMRQMFAPRTERVSGMAAGRHHVDERLVRIALLEERLEVGFLGDPRVKRGVDAADHRRQVRRENQPHARFAACARPCAISGRWRWPGTPYALKLSHASAKQSVHSALRPAPQTPDFASAMRCGEVDDAGLEQRQEAELHRGRIAAGIRDDARLADALAVHLAAGRTPPRAPAPGQACFILYQRSHSRDVLHAEVRREVDHAHAGVEQRARLVHGDAVRRGEEHDVARRQRFARGLGELEIDAAAQVGEHAAHRRAGFLARGDRRQLAPRMLREQAQQLDARVARAADDSSLIVIEKQKPPKGGFQQYVVYCSDTLTVHLLAQHKSESE